MRTLIEPPRKNVKKARQEENVRKIPELNKFIARNRLETPTARQPDHELVEKGSARRQEGSQSTLG